MTKSRARARARRDPQLPAFPRARTRARARARPLTLRFQMSLGSSSPHASHTVCTCHPERRARDLGGRGSMHVPATPPTQVRYLGSASAGRMGRWKNHGSVPRRAHPTEALPLQRDGSRRHLASGGDAMKIDMSAKAVTTRLQRVSQLRKLCLSLMKAKPIRPQQK